MIASAQIAIYPLRQDHLSPAVTVVRETLAEAGLRAETGPMSTLVIGDAPAIFSALAQAFERAAALGHAVITATVSNACPIPD